MKTNKTAAFTLVELMIVLALIAIITGLATNEAWRWRGARLGETSLKNLAEIKEAVVGEAGYLDDLGRLPNHPRDLSQLWTPPDSETEFYAVRPATFANLSPPASPLDADEAISIPCGWRGPYLRLPLGKEKKLLDAWGNAMETPDDAGYTARLIRTPDGSVIGVKHLGADGAPDDVLTPQEEQDKDAKLLFYPPHLPPASLTNSTLTVTVNAYDPDGNPAPPAALQITARVYAPDGGKIAVSKATAPLLNNTLTLEIPTLTPGTRTLRIEYGTNKTPPRQILIRPGANAVTERILSF